MNEQYILAVPRDKLASVGFEAGFTPKHYAQPIIQEILESGDFLPRAYVERNQNLLQPIPCGLIHCDKRVLVLERSERNRAHSLHRRLVLWAGGHAQIEDTVAPSEDLMLAALDRELNEELDLRMGIPEMQGIVFDGRSLHFAVVYDVPAVEPPSTVVSANEEFRLSKGKSPSGRFLSLQEIDRRFSQLESWSRIMLADILLRRSELSRAGANSLQLKFDFPINQPAFLVRQE
ncbi:MAG: hypothetical protein IH958_04060 [Chloroflexi bacterium]|nr:hypothetical protein [Chloroflexota bacterium]